MNRYGFSRLLVMAVLMLAVRGAAGNAQHLEGSVGFQRNDRVFTWQTGNSGAYRFNDRAAVTYSNNLSTSLNRTSGDAEDRWYDTVNNNAEFGYTLSDALRFTVTADEEWSRDTMSRFGKSLLTTVFDGGVNYTPSAGLRLTTNVGHINDRRFENRDSGVRWEGGLRYEKSPLEAMKVTFSGDGEVSNLKRARKNYDVTAGLAYAMDDVVMRMQLSDRLDRRGYFSDIDRSGIENRERQERTFELMVERGSIERLTDELAFSITTDLGTKDITDTANDNPNSSKYRNNAHGRLRNVELRLGRSFFRRLGVTWGMEYGIDRNGVERLNRRRDQTDVGTRGTLAFMLGPADSIHADGWIQRTRIDTPEGVPNDRDELKVEGGVSYLHRFTERFKTMLDFRVLETHYVNIDVSQSSQNKWMKTYLLSPSVVYSPLSSVTVEHAVNVYANYITYDFDSDFAPRSNISRRVSSETWVDARISRRTVVRAGVMFEDNEYARLTTGNEKIPAEEGIRRFGDLSVSYVFFDWLSLEPRYVYAIRHDRDVAGSGATTIRREVDQTFGLDCLLFSGENGAMVIGLKRIVRTTERYPVRIRDYVNMTVRYQF